MIKKYGSITKRMQEVGRIGGQNGEGPDYRGGFAGNRELAVKAGAKGGRVSRRKSEYFQIYEENRERIQKARKTRGLKKLARELGVPYPSLVHHISVYMSDK